MAQVLVAVAEQVKHHNMAACIQRSHHFACTEPPGTHIRHNARPDSWACTPQYAPLRLKQTALNTGRGRFGRCLRLAMEQMSPLERTSGLFAQIFPNLDVSSCVNTMVTFNPADRPPGLT